MIILDTNQLNRYVMSLDTPVLAVLRGIAKETGDSLALPSLVLDEHVSYCERKVRTLIVELSSTQRDLKRLDSRWHGQDTLRPPNPATAAETRAQELREIFEVLPTPSGAADESLRRELMRQPPAYEANEKGLGARDVAIWLTVLSALGDNDVYFVARDKRAYGENSLNPVLLEEADSIRPDALTLCPSIEDLLDFLATKRMFSPEDEKRLCHDESILPLVQEALTSPQGVGLLVAYVHSTLSRPFSFNSNPIFSSKGVRGTRAYAIEDTVWVSTRITWNVSQMLSVFTLDEQDHSPYQWWIKASVETTVLAKIASDGTVLEAQILGIGNLDDFRMITSTSTLPLFVANDEEDESSSPC